MTDLGLLRFDVDGAPATQGSLSAIPFLVTCQICATGKRCGQKLCIAGKQVRVNVPQDAEVRAWRDRIAMSVHVGLNRLGRKERPVFAEGPLAVALLFRLKRPLGHFTARGVLAAEGQRNPMPWHKPDVDKLARAVLDACGKSPRKKDQEQTPGLVYSDDAQDVALLIDKAWAKPPSDGGVTILVGPRPADFTYAALGAAADEVIRTYDGPPPIGDLFSR